MAILRPVTKTLISSASWGVPITDEVNRLTPLVDGRTPTAWQVLALTNGWTNVGNSSVAVMKFGPVLLLRGGIANGTVGSACFTLPTGYRPTINQNFNAPGWAGPVSYGALIQIYTTGVATVLYANSGAGLVLDGLVALCP